jgi:hypothetical protein
MAETVEHVMLIMALQAELVELVFLKQHTQVQMVATAVAQTALAELDR